MIAGIGRIKRNRGEQICRLLATADYRFRRRFVREAIRVDQTTVSTVHAARHEAAQMSECASAADASSRANVQHTR